MQAKQWTVDKCQNGPHERTVYVAPTTQPGDSVRWGDWNERDSLMRVYRKHDQFGPVLDSGHYVRGIPLTIIELATGSDYSGNLVEHSNARVLKERFPWLVTLYGGHGTFGVAYLGKRENQNPELIEAIDALDIYPLADDDDHTQLEMERVDEAWSEPHGGGRSDWKRALVEMWSLDEDHEYDADKLDDALVDQLWYDCVEMLQGGEGHLNEQGDSIYFPIDRVIEDIRRDRRDLYRATYSPDDNRPIIEKLESLRESCLVHETEE